MCLEQCLTQRLLASPAPLVFKVGLYDRVGRYFLKQALNGGSFLTYLGNSTFYLSSQVIETASSSTVCIYVFCISSKARRRKSGCPLQVKLLQAQSCLVLPRRSSSQPRPSCNLPLLLLSCPLEATLVLQVLGLFSLNVELPGQKMHSLYLNG